MQIETERLILRNFRERDLEDYWDYVQMENVGPRAGWPAYTDKNKAIERLKMECEKPYMFAIVWKENNKVVGSIELMDCIIDRYKNLDIEVGAKEIGFVLSEKYWGKGIMVEACRGVLKLAFEELNVKVIYIGHAKANINSGRVQDKLGFEVVGEYSNYKTWIDGSTTDYIERKMDSNLWLKLYGKSKKNIKIIN